MTPTAGAPGAAGSPGTGGSPATAGWFETVAPATAGPSPVPGGETGRGVFCSWSGGKDSALALWHVVRAGARPGLLVTMMTEDGARSRSHGVRREVLAAQADAVGVPVRFVPASWDDYEAAFAGAVRAAVADGLCTGVFGDIDIDAHRRWVQRLTGDNGAACRLPLWQRPRAELVTEALDAGFRAVLVTVRDGLLPADLLGRELDAALLARFAAAGVDPAGENGEYHTFVTDGPLFRHPLDVRAGPVVARADVHTLDLTLAPGGGTSSMRGR